LKNLGFMAYGRFRALRGEPVRFRGAFASYDEALANVRAGRLAGYDHDSVAPVSQAFMQERAPWDYPVLYWLQRLAPDIRCLVDAGGHIGVKYRAFAPYLDLDRLQWVVYDLPALVRAGRAQQRPQDHTLSFVEQLERGALVRVGGAVARIVIDAHDDKAVAREILDLRAALCARSAPARRIEDQRCRPLELARLPDRHDERLPVGVLQRGVALGDRVGTAGRRPSRHEDVPAGRHDNGHDQYSEEE
jgi:hypothetical protein